MFSRGDNKMSLTCLMVNNLPTLVDIRSWVPRLVNVFCEEIVTVCACCVCPANAASRTQHFWFGLCFGRTISDICRFDKFVLCSDSVSCAASMLPWVNKIGFMSASTCRMIDAVSVALTQWKTHSVKLHPDHFSRWRHCDLRLSFVVALLSRFAKMNPFFHRTLETVTLSGDTVRIFCSVNAIKTIFVKLCSYFSFPACRNNLLLFITPGRADTWILQTVSHMNSAVRRMRATLQLTTKMHVHELLLWICVYVCMLPFNDVHWGV